MIREVATLPQRDTLGDEQRLGLIEIQLGSRRRGALSSAAVGKSEDPRDCRYHMTHADVLLWTLEPESRRAAKRFAGRSCHETQDVAWRASSGARKNNRMPIL